MGNQQGERPEPVVERFGRLNVVDDVIRLRAADAIQHPILACPAAENEAGSFEYFTGRDLDVMIDQAVRILIGHGFNPVCVV